MPRIEMTENISASPEKVWDFICNVRRGPEWVTVMKEVLYVSDEPVRKGSVYHERFQIGPIISEKEWRIIEFESPRVQVHESREQTLHALLTLRVEPEGEGSRFVHQIEYRMIPGFRPLGWLLEKLFVHRMITKEIRKTVQNAKRILETEL